MSEKMTRIEITLDGDWKDNDSRNEKLMDDLVEWLHDRLCGRDHPTEDETCTTEFFLGGVVIDADDAWVRDEGDGKS